MARPILTPDEVMFRERPSIPRPDLALRFADMLLRACPESHVFMMVFDGYASRASGRIVRGSPGLPMGGYFDRLDAVACEFQRIDGVSLYICPNPIIRADRSPVMNDFGRLYKGMGVKAGDVEKLRWIVVDIDPVVEGGRSGDRANATDVEHGACLRLAESIVRDEPAIGRACVTGSSGNGAAILIRADLGNTEVNREAVASFIGSISAKHRHPGAGIDRNWDPTKKIGVPGSLKAKGTHSPDRPRRMVDLTIPERFVEVFDVTTWLAANRIEPDIPEPRKPSFHVPSGETSLPPIRVSNRYGSDADDARRWLDRQPPAVSGQRGRLVTFRTVATLLKGWDLSVDETVRVISDWNARCEPPWTDSELYDKAHDADRKRDVNPRGFMRGAGIKSAMRAQGIRQRSLPVFTFDLGE
jgi:hypothetical protein